MNQQNYHCEIAVPLPAKKTFEDICNVGGWWAADFKGNIAGPDDVEIWIRWKI